MLEILFEDNHLIAINKPAGLLTQPTDTVKDSLETQVKTWIKETYHKPGNVFLGTVHRLDKPVSGIVLFAKTSKALSRLNASIRSKDMQKTYCALVEGKLPNPLGTLEHYLRHDEHSASVSNKNDVNAKLARLHYKTVSSSTIESLVEIQLETGRYHQIRAQLAAIGCPIVGDSKYGSRRLLIDHIIALHHLRLEFKHPITGEKVVIESPVPERFHCKDK